MVLLIIDFILIGELFKLVQRPVKRSNAFQAVAAEWKGVGCWRRKTIINFFILCISICIVAKEDPQNSTVEEIFGFL